MDDVSDPNIFRCMRFETLEEAVRLRNGPPSRTWERKRHKEMPDQIDERIFQDMHLFPCPSCQQPLYQKGRFGTMLDLNDWECPRCKKTVTLKTDGLIR